MIVLELMLIVKQQRSNKQLKEMNLDILSSSMNMISSEKIQKTVIIPPTQILTLIKCKMDSLVMNNRNKRNNKQIMDHKKYKRPRIKRISIITLTQMKVSTIIPNWKESNSKNNNKISDILFLTQIKMVRRITQIFIRITTILEMDIFQEIRMSQRATLL